MRWFCRSIVAVALLTAPAWSNSANAQGTLRVAFGSSLNTLDPAKTKIGEEYIQNFLIYSGVTEIDRDGKLKPDLAETLDRQRRRQDVDLQDPQGREVPSWP